MFAAVRTGSDNRRREEYPDMQLRCVFGEPFKIFTLDKITACPSTSQMKGERNESKNNIYLCIAIINFGFLY
jgi:hypothetical protein